MRCLRVGALSLAHPQDYACELAAATTTATSAAATTAITQRRIFARVEILHVGR